MGPNARLRLIRDRFITGHPDCAVRRHLDSVPPETPIRDIVDRCRVWESHADADAQRIVKPTLERERPVYTVNEPECMPADQVMAAVTTTSAGLADLEASLRHLLLTTPVQAPPPRPVPTEIMLERLLSNAPAPPPQTAITDIEIMLHTRLLPGMPSRTPRSRLVPARRDWATIVCFSCGKPGHGVPTVG